jgi:type I restriction enzyme M protein
VRPNDILFVNDGTFLIGRTAMISEGEERILIQSHLKKFRVMPKCKFDAFYLMFLLNTEIVQKQIRARTFVQATISTIGDRLMDVVLPISIDESYVSEKSTVVKRIIDQKRSTRELMKQVLASKH